MTQTKRQWCAMLAKLVAPMDPETAAKAFVDMLPLLPLDDTLYTRATLEAAATCERKTAVPNYADLSRVLGRAAKERLPVAVRMGYKPALSQQNAKRPTKSECDYVAALAKSLVAELKAKQTPEKTCAQTKVKS